MSCRGCAEKANRHLKGTPVVGDLDSYTKGNMSPEGRPTPAAQFTGKGFEPEPVPENQEDPIPPDMDALSAILAAQRMTYEELTARRQMHQRMIKRQAEAMLEEMTDAMRRVHVDELIAVANSERLALPGMTPSQAVVALKETLSRPDFAFIEELYPGLTDGVNRRFSKLVEDQLPGPQNQ